MRLAQSYSSRSDQYGLGKLTIVYNALRVDTSHIDSVDFDRIHRKMATEEKQ